MMFTGYYVCPECKPEAIRKLAMGLPIGSLWRKSRILIARRDSTLPGRCLTCNEDIHGKRPFKQTIYWSHPLWYLLLLAAPLYCTGLLAYLLAVAIVQKKTTLSVGLCARHRKRRAIGVLSGVASVAVGLVSIVIGLSEKLPMMSSGMVALIGSVFFFGGMLVWAGFARIVVPVKIDAAFVHVKGAGRAFLDELPEWPEA